MVNSGLLATGPPVTSGLSYLKSYLSTTCSNVTVRTTSVHWIAVGLVETY